MKQARATVKLGGILGARFGHKRVLGVSSPREAVEALCCTVPGFRDFVLTSKTQFKVLVSGSPINPRTELADPTGSQEIRIVPVIRGAKSDFWQVVEGAALIALSVALANPEIIYLGAKLDMALAGFTGMMGVTMAVGGISRMLTGTPSTPQNQSNQSYLFSGAQNTAAQGIPVPVLYGEFMALPPLISEGIDTENYNPTLFNASYNGTGTWTGNGDTTAWGASLTAQ